MRSIDTKLKCTMVPPSPPPQPMGVILLVLCLVSIGVWGRPDAAMPSELPRASNNNQSADLTILINETLSINNKSLGDAQAKDDWTFDMVEYDLMEFLQDLSARYKMNNKSSSVDQTTLPPPESSLGARDNQPAPNTSSSYAAKPVHPTNVPQLSSSLATGDHEIAESSWQYGIFDRFTRPKSTTAKPTTASDYGSDVHETARLDVRLFNSNECGLRTYTEETHFYPQTELEPDSGIKQRRQKLPLSPVDRKKLDSVLALISDDQARDDKASLAAPVEEVPDPSSFESHSDSAPDSEFNLASRRHWLQQQLGNTLQMLQGLGNSTQPNLTSPGEIFSSNHHEVPALGVSVRENMMKKSNKMGKSSDLGQFEADSNFNSKESDQHKLIARQDELKLEARVIGGSDARLGDSPWSVSLQALVSRPGTGAVEYRHYCGGTIIGERYVLTAAHCLDFMVGRESRLFVVIGDLNWRMSTASLYGRRFGIEKLIIHSGYKSTAFGHDIGLIKTKESMKPLKANGRYIVNSVCLPQRNVEHTGEAELVGWGLFSNRNEMADSLQIADVPILPRPLCVDLYKRRTGLIQWLIGIELITDKQVCAGTFGRGICQGDSGSALVVNEKVVTAKQKRQISKILRQGASFERDTKQTRATVIGVVAFGGIRRCSYQSLPGVYMQTSKYLDWITRHIEQVGNE